MPLHDARSPGLTEALARDGAVLVNQVLAPDEVQEVRREIERYVREALPYAPPKWVRHEPDGTSFRSIYFMDVVDPYFAQLGARDDLRALAQRATGFEPVLHYVETFNKPARVGSEITRHQEVAFIPLDPPEMIHIWIALDDADEENGAIQYWLGTHRHGLLPHISGGPGGTQLTIEAERVDALGAPIGIAVLPRGGAAIHNGLIIHGSAANASARERLGLVVAYRAAHARVVR